MVTAPELKIAAAGPKQAFLGRKVQYEWTVTNVGDGAADDARVEALIPREARTKAAPPTEGQSR